jgi:pimeloyl-ACP methyl ester carboxylesterase
LTACLITVIDQAGTAHMVTLAAMFGAIQVGWCWVIAANRKPGLKPLNYHLRTCTMQRKQDRLIDSHSSRGNIMLDKLNLEDVELEYEVHGTGEPVVLIHGSVVADTYLPMLSEPALSRYKLLRYRRRGFGNSTHPTSVISIRDQANDCLRLLRKLSIPRAHVVGHSYGGVIALQLALDHPEAVHSLAVLEPALVGIIPNSAQFSALEPVVETYQNRHKQAALEAFLQLVAGPNWREWFDRLPGSFEMALADADNFFRVELPALSEWQFTPDDASRIHQPMLAVLGAESAPVFPEIQKLVLSWFPQARPVTIPRANHMLQASEPRAVAEALADFWNKVPMG